MPVRVADAARQHAQHADDGRSKTRNIFDTNSYGRANDAPGATRAVPVGRY